MKKPAVLWILAFVITLASVFYQRLTGPTHSVRGTVAVGGTDIDFSLPRSHESTADCRVALTVPSEDITGEYRYRRFRSFDSWSTLPLERAGDTLTASIPKQPAAGKVMYEIFLSDAAGDSIPLSKEPVVIRFTDPVPGIVLGFHIAFMIAAMLVSTRAGLEAWAGRRRIVGYSLATAVLLFVGGLILGPVVQKYAFDAYWTGWPFGQDLTDNKTAVAFVFWIVAIWRAKAVASRGWVIAAAAVTLVVYLIPHSLLGSELDYTELEGQAAALPTVIFLPAIVTVFERGVGGQADFIRGARHAEGGLSIIALKSTTRNGEPKILDRCPAGITTTAIPADQVIIVTENGAFDPRRLSLGERAVGIAHLAHPDQRENLLRAIFDSPAFHNPKTVESKGIPGFTPYERAVERL
jgi:hypothetical protein